MLSRKKSSPPWRRMIQITFFVLITLIAVGHTLEEQGIVLPFIPQASLHAVCPFGGVVSLYDLITNGALIRKIHESSVVLMVAVFVLALLFGPVFCGWICPFGTIQDFFSSLGRKLFKMKRSYVIPQKFDRWLRWLRYGVLAWVLYMTAATGVLVFADVDPYYTLFNLWSGEIAIGGIIALVVVLAASLFIERPFCKYACPYGALLGLSNLIRIFPVRRKASTCISCNACTRKCPMGIDVAKQDVIRDVRCISCNECSSENACPVADTVAFRAVKWEATHEE